MRWQENIKLAVGILGGWIASVYGGWSAIMTTLVCFMVIDLVTGWACALFGKSKKTTGGGLSSKVGWEGIVRKVLTLILVWAASQLDIISGNADKMFQTMAAGFFVANEGLSIIENAMLMGVNPPPFMVRILEVLRDKSGEGAVQSDKKTDDSTNGG